MDRRSGAGTGRADSPVIRAPFPFDAAVHAISHARCGPSRIVRIHGVEGVADLTSGLFASAPGGVIATITLHSSAANQFSPPKRSMPPSPVRNVAVLVGSLRKESLTRKVANALAKLAPSTLKLETMEIGQLQLYNQDLESTPPAEWIAFRERVRASDAVLFATIRNNRSHHRQ